MTEIIHEYVQNTHQLPFKIFQFHAHDLSRIIPMHWHQSTEILYCSKGSLSVKVKESTYLLTKGDFIAINPYEIHTTTSPSKNWILCIQLPFDFISLLTSNYFYRDCLFDTDKCTSVCNHNLKLTALFEEALQITCKKNNGLVANLKLVGLVISILAYLFEHYSIKKINP